MHGPCEIHRRTYAPVAKVIAALAGRPSSLRETDAKLSVRSAKSKEQTTDSKPVVPVISNEEPSKSNRKPSRVNNPPSFNAVPEASVASTKRDQSSNHKGERSKSNKIDAKDVDCNQSVLGRKRKLQELAPVPVEATKQQSSTSTGKSRVETVDSKSSNDPTRSNKRARREKQQVVARDKTGDQVVKGKDQVKEVLGKKSIQTRTKKATNKDR
jgi:hypothetical protein